MPYIQPRTPCSNSVASAQKLSVRGYRECLRVGTQTGLQMILLALTICVNGTLLTPLLAFISPESRGNIVAYLKGEDMREFMRAIYKVAGTQSSENSNDHTKDHLGYLLLFWTMGSNKQADRLGESDV